ncbi:MAG TPA: DUF3106 domain-containing protein [Candidatus Acidoferrum sp.]|nr:DUF3106 domain-containing protein [Candidatus Acidoferrum sp.]
MIFARASILLLIGICVASAQQPGPALQQLQPPLPVFTNTGLHSFRRLLAMNEAEREAFIVGRSKEAQPILRAKVPEYLALTAEAREARLQSLELRALLLPLMSMAEPQRTLHLQTLPPEKRKVVEERLRTWTILPTPLAKDVLENEAAVRFFLQSQSSTEREAMLTNMSPQQRVELQKSMARLDAMPPERREMAVRNVERYFALDAKERDQTLSALSDRERAMVTNALERLSILPPEQRGPAVEGLKKFKGLSAAEQQQFLRGAARWQLMPEKERQLWRDLVTRTRITPPPPMPPSPEMLRPRALSSNE